MNVVVQQGVTLGEARQVAMDVFAANFERLSTRASIVATERVERLTESLIHRIAESPDALASAEDPDFQKTLFEAQVAYARSGDDALEGMLLELLANRAAVGQAAFDRILLNEAVSIVSKLTEDDLMALAINFGATRIEAPLEPDIRAYYRYLGSVLGPVVPDRNDAYVRLRWTEDQLRHIEYTGAARLQESVVDLSTALAGVNRAYFTLGFQPESVPDDLLHMLERKDVVRPCLRAPDRLQIFIDDRGWQSTMAAARRHQGAKRRRVDSSTPSVTTMLAGEWVPDAEVWREVNDPELGVEDLASAWYGGVGRLTLSPVGDRIGRAYLELRRDRRIRMSEP